MDEIKPKRPTGLTLIVILWFIFGLVNIFGSLQTIFLEIEALPYLYGPLITHPWFNTGIIAELTVAVFVVILGAIQIITVPGLWNGKPYSYKLALGVPILLLIANFSSFMLYATAPAELSLNSGISIFFVVMGFFWLIIYWWYLREPHVQAFLGVVKSESIIHKEKELDTQQEPVSIKKKTITDVDRYFCRYCGKENEADAVFCEKCGKKLK